MHNTYIIIIKNINILEKTKKISIKKYKQN